MNKVKFSFLIFFIAYLFSEGVLAQPLCDCTDPNETIVIDGLSFGSAGIDLSQVIQSQNISWENECILIKGILNVDVDLEIVDCEIYGQDLGGWYGVKVGAFRIESGKSLTVFDSHFDACHEFYSPIQTEWGWEGFLIENGGELNLYNSHIEDAYIGISILGDCTLNCDGNTFLNNCLGIYAFPSEKQKIINGSPLVNNIFIGNDDFTAACHVLSTQNPSCVPNPIAGIFLNDVSHLTVGSNHSTPFYGIQPNHFEGPELECAIVNVRSGMTIVNAEIENLNTEEYNSIDDPEQAHGAGVYSYNNLYTNLYYSKIKNCQAPISSFNSELDIVGNKIIIDPVGEQVFDFVKTKYIDILGGTNINIKRNDFLITGSQLYTRGIYAENLYPKNFDIRLNDFNTKKSEFKNCRSVHFIANDNQNHKVEVFESYSFELINNDFTKSLNSSMLDITSGGRHTLIDNDFLDVYINGSYPNVNSKMSNGNTYECNYFDGGYQGIRFDGPNAATYFKRTTFDDCDESLILVDGEIGPQPPEEIEEDYYGNTWIGNNNVGKIIAGSGSTPDEIAEKSQFTINPFDLPVSGLLQPPSYDPANIGAIWFKPDDEKDNEFCEPVSPWVEKDKDICELDEKPWWMSLDCQKLQYYLDSVLFTSFSSPNMDHYLWSKQRYVLKELLNYPDLRDSCSYVDSLWSGFIGKSVLDYVYVDSLWGRLHFPDGVDCDSITIVEDSIRIFVEELRELDSLLVKDTINTEVELNQKLIKLHQLDSISSVWMDMKESIAVFHKDKLGALSSEIDRLIADSLYEITLKRYWQLAMEKMTNGKDTLSQGEWLELAQLAQLCPLEAGVGVYGARSLYNQYDPTVNYDDLQLCNMSPPSPLPLEIVETNFEVQVKIAPNPSLETFVFSMFNPNKKQISFDLFNLEGRVLESYDFGTVKEIEKTIGLTIEKAGLYIARISIDGKAYISNKLIKLDK